MKNHREKEAINNGMNSLHLNDILNYELFINDKDIIQFNINKYNIKLKKKLYEKNWYFITAKYNSKKLK